MNYIFQLGLMRSLAYWVKKMDYTASCDELPCFAVADAQRGSMSAIRFIKPVEGYTWRNRRINWVTAPRTFWSIPWFISPARRLGAWSDRRACKISSASWSLSRNWACAKRDTTTVKYSKPVFRAKREWEQKHSQKINYTKRRSGLNGDKVIWKKKLQQQQQITKAKLIESSAFPTIQSFCQSLKLVRSIWQIRFNHFIRGRFRISLLQSFFLSRSAQLGNRPAA